MSLSSQHCTTKTETGVPKLAVLWLFFFVFLQIPWLRNFSVALFLIAELSKSAQNLADSKNIQGKTSSDTLVCLKVGLAWLLGFY